jgi:hypothetical protein
LAHLVRTLNEIGVHPVLLKGAAALAGGLYPTAGERMIGDIDVLVPAPRLPDILCKLMAVGYEGQSPESEWPDPSGFETKGHHYRPFASLDWPVRVEFHVHPVSLPLLELLDGEEMFRDAMPLSWRGGECLLPSPTHFILHNVIHAFLMHFAVTGKPLSQRQLFEFVLANQRYGQQIDWRSITHRFDTFGYRNALRDYVLIANTYFGFEAPEHVDIDIRDRVRVSAQLFRLDLESPVVEGLLALSCQLRNRARVLKKNPEVLKKLFTTGFYSGLYVTVAETRQANLN